MLQMNSVNTWYANVGLVDVLAFVSVADTGSVSRQLAI